MKIYNNISEIIGNTPLIKLNKLAPEYDICVKVENQNPGFSVKDRVAMSIIDQAEKEGLLKPNSAIIEATSGNTGIGLALMAASRGYKLYIAMPSSMSVERQKLMRHLGAELVLTDPALGMNGAIKKAEELAQTLPNAFLTKQFSNPANVKIHYETTGVEIYNDTDGKVDVFVTGVGTGGTISGVGKALKERNSKIEIIGVEPADSAVLNKQAAGKHKIQGIGAGFVPDNYLSEVVDKVITVTNDEAIQTARRLAKEEGILGGISSGANVAAALKLAAMPDNKGKKIVTTICDTAERYLSTELFED
ncbi:cysteine synthase A [Lentisphaerota bacterium WC36G]|nr:cysteine synthase A [Lentisphaerae bacterium WC36]